MYGDLEYLYGELIEIELSDRRKGDNKIKNEQDIETKFKEEINKFKEIECYDLQHNIDKKC